MMTGSFSGAPAPSSPYPVSYENYGERLVARYDLGGAGVRVDLPARSEAPAALTRVEDLLTTHDADIRMARTSMGAIADSLAEELGRQCAGGALVDLGGFVGTAGEPPRGGWTLELADSVPARRIFSASSVPLLGGGAATVSTSATGPWTTATVLAPTSGRAAALAAGALSLGRRAPGWLVAHGNAALLLAADGRCMVTARWPIAWDTAESPAVATRPGIAPWHRMSLEAEPYVRHSGVKALAAMI